MEKWLPIAGYEGLYEVSSAGRVRSLDREAPNTKSSVRLIRGQIIAQYVRAEGYHTVKLAKARVKTSHYVHRLVAKAFHGDGEPGQEVRHGNGDKGCNREGNLSWGTRLDNMDDRTRLDEHAVGERHGHAKLTGPEVLAIRRDSRQHAFIAAQYKVSRRLIGMIKAGKIWTHIHG